MGRNSPNCQPFLPRALRHTSLTSPLALEHLSDLSLASHGCGYGNGLSNLIYYAYAFYVGLLEILQDIACLLRLTCRILISATPLLVLLTMPLLNEYRTYTNPHLAAESEPLPNRLLWSLDKERSQCILISARPLRCSVPRYREIFFFVCQCVEANGNAAGGHRRRDRDDCSLQGRCAYGAYLSTCCCVKLC
jgi:hypothetical protein